MTDHRMSTTECQKKLSKEWIERLKNSDDAIILTHHGKKSAVLVGFNTWKSFRKLPKKGLTD